MVQTDRQVRLTILSFAMGAFAIGITEFAAMGLLPYYAADLGVSEPQAGHAVSAYAIGVVIGAPVLAVLGSYLPRKLLLILLMIYFAVTNIFTALASGLDSMVISRALAGLPHGAFLGIAMLLAAEMSPPGKKAAGVASVLMGLTVANIVGVPAAGAIGQYFGWRWCFVLVAVIAMGCAAMMARVAPRDTQDGPAVSPLRELSALASRAMWLALGVGAIGFGAVFAVYSYFSAALIDNGAPEWSIPLALSLFGVGATAGNYVAGRLANWSQFGGTLVLLLGMVATTLLYAAVMGNWVAMSLAVMALGLTAGIVIPIQMRLMEVAGNGKTLASALNHAAFNAGNAIGPWLSGLGLAAGYGWYITGLAGAVLALGGIVMLGFAWIDSRPRRGHAIPAQ
ncbi:MFS transporter [Citreicella sp. C3M06]|uniref:MFS transporter n=1 Tax=Citreicella sp. C3M06 TaxID=2841564 RepID=UPI001C091267|nr:MFS transporter [Citreicella sp. C3M06]MBU2960147.1 MFS transporter [Citreicella sp. C3M06]